MKKDYITLSADPADSEDRAISIEGIERGQRARLIRKTRNDLGLSQVELASCLRVPVGMLQDWEQAMAPDFAIVYIRVIALHPNDG